jgi:hypothetical protein
VAGLNKNGAAAQTNVNGNSNTASGGGALEMNFNGSNTASGVGALESNSTGPTTPTVQTRFFTAMAAVTPLSESTHVFLSGRAITMLLLAFPLEPTCQRAVTMYISAQE